MPEDQELRKAGLWIGTCEAPWGLCSNPEPSPQLQSRPEPSPPAPLPPKLQLSPGPGHLLLSPGEGWLRGYQGSRLTLQHPPFPVTPGEWGPPAGKPRDTLCFSHSGQPWLVPSPLLEGPGRFSVPTSPTSPIARWSSSAPSNIQGRGARPRTHSHQDG